MKKLGMILYFESFLYSMNNDFVYFNRDDFKINDVKPESVFAIINKKSPESHKDNSITMRFAKDQKE
jgi:hypothetical protein